MSSARPEGDQNAPAASAPSSRPAPTPDPHAKPGRPPGRPWRAEGLPPGKQGAPPPGWRRWLPSRWWFLVYAIVFALFTFQDLRSGPPSIAYSEFQAQVRAKNVKEIFARGQSIQGELRTKKPLPGASGPTYERFATERPVFAKDDLLSDLDQAGASV